MIVVLAEGKTFKDINLWDLKSDLTAGDSFDVYDLTNNIRTLAIFDGKEFMISSSGNGVEISGQPETAEQAYDRAMRVVGR